jgi:DNA invertase Pin-like site-specific DNA recombinase
MITTLGERRADTGTSTGRFDVGVLAGLADVESGLIRTRTAEGRSRAKAQGKHMGQPPSLTPAQQKEAIRRRAEGATLDELARSSTSGFHHSPCHAHRMSSLMQTAGTRLSQRLGLIV